MSKTIVVSNAGNFGGSASAILRRIFFANGILNSLDSEIAVQMISLMGSPLPMASEVKFFGSLAERIEELSGIQIPPAERDVSPAATASSEFEPGALPGGFDLAAPAIQQEALAMIARAFRFDQRGSEVVVEGNLLTFQSVNWGNRAIVVRVAEVGYKEPSS